MQKLLKNCGLPGFKIRAKIFAVLFFTTLLSVKAVANVYVPTTFTDPAYTAINNATGVITAGAGIGLISLRSALEGADALGGTHTITLSTGTYNLSRAPFSEITIGNTAQTITINGNGPANTIINMVNDANRDRILFINPVGTTNNVITIVQGIKFQNAFLNSDPYGGAGICAGGGTGNALTVTNCTFDNNILPANAFGGAAVCMQVSGDLTVDNCTFTNNVSNDADGGAILFIIFNNPGYDGDLLVTNSTFTGNSVIFPGAGTSNGGALAFTGQGGIVGTFNITINNNTFTTNTADGLGGAISANNSPNLSIPQIHFNRFFNNTSAASALSSGLHFVESSGSVNAENNWWGCNTNPVSGSSTSPCNQAGGDVAGGGSLDANPWLQLKTTASPNPICNTPAGLGNTTTVTTSFLNNSDGTAIPVANLTRLIGLPVTWGPTTLGSLSAQQLTIQASGNATATFTSNGTGGAATVNTQVDNVPVADLVARATITVNTLPTVTNPVNITACAGGTAIFTSTITGTPAPTIVWRIGATALVNGLQVSGSTVSGQGTNTLTITNVQPGDAAVNYNVQASNTCGTATSTNATLAVNAVTGGTVGSDQTICSGGDPALFTESVASTGSGALTYQWQSSTTSCAAGFSNIGGATATTYDAPAGLAVTTFYRRVTTSTLNAVPCTANSNCITVSVNSVTGGTVAADQTICSGGDPAAFTQTVASTGTALTYQWQSSTTSCAAGFTDIGGATGTTYDAPAGLTVTTYYRRVTTSTLNAVVCTANSNCITVTVNPTNTITLTSAAGTDAQTVLINTPITNITYSTTGATGATFSGLPAGVNGVWAANVVTISGSPTTIVGSPFNYTVTLTGGCGLITATGTITVFNCSITLTSAAGTNAQAVCINSPITNITYSTVGATGATFSGLPTGVTGNWAANVATISGTPTVAGTFNYTVTLTGGGCGAFNATGTITVNPIPDAVATPSSQSRCSGQAITPIIMSGAVSGTSFNWVRDNFPTIGGTIGASGSGNITGNLINNTGSPVTVTFTITPTANSCPGTPITATVTVNPLPAASITGGNAYVCQESNPVLTAGFDPGYTYQWGRSLFTTPFTNLGTAQTQVITASGNYLLTVTNQYGCVDTAMTVMNVADYRFNGTLAPGDALQTGRINRFAVISTCAAPKACPGLFTAVGNRLYDSYTITNPRSVPVCATIGINSFCATNIFCVAYLNSFNPASLCTNYLADGGSSFTFSGFYEATIPANGTIVVVVHEVNTGTGCTGYTLTVDVPREAAGITVTPPSPVCSGVPITLTASAANSYLWTPGGATTQAIVVNPPSGANNYSVQLGYGNFGCNNNAATVVNVGTTPDVNAVANQYFCAGTSTPVISLTGSVPGTTFNWTNTNTAIGLGASGSGDIPSFIATNATAAPISGTITVTPVNGSCTGTPITFTITVASTPSITSVTNDDICEPGGVVNLAAAGNGTINWWNALTGGVVLNTGTTFNPNVTTTTTYYVDATTTTGPQNLLAMPAQSNTFPGNVRGYWFTAPTDFVITSLSVPTTASSGPMSIAVMKFTGNVPPPIFSATTNAFTTVFQTGNNPSLGAVPCNIPVAAGEVIGILGYRGNINSYAPGDYNTTIAGFPVQLQRLGMQFPLSTSPPHDIWREFGAGTSISRVEFEYSAGQNCVSAPRVPVTATVFTLPTPTATPSSQTVCSGTPITTIVLASQVAGTTFAWTRDNTVAVTGIAASGSGNISGSLTNTTNAPVTVTFTITATSPDGCVAPLITATVLVNPTPNAVATPASQTVCSGTPITTIVLSGAVAGTTFNWTRNNNVTVTGIAASGSGDISGTLTNTTTADVLVTFTITPTANGCPGAAITATVLVKPTPTVVATPPSQTICSGAIAAISFTGNLGSFATYNWTRDNTVAVTGLPASGSGNINAALTNTTNAPVTVTFTITPVFNGCTGIPITATVLVNPTANVIATPASQTICSGSAITTIVLTSAVAGTTFTWTRDNNVTVTGIAASGSGNISGSLTNTTNAPITVTFTITPSANGCTGTPSTATVLVNPTPNAVATPASQTVCSANPITTIVLTSAVAGTTYTWTRDNNVTVTGIAASGSGNISGTLTNTTFAPVTVTFTITPSANGCPGPSITATVLVNPTPNAVATPASQTICSDGTITTIVLTSAVSGASFSWTRDNTVTVTGIANSGNGNISGTLTNTTNAPITVTFTITPSANGCPGIPITATVLVNPTPNAVATPASQTICSANPITTIVLTGAVAGTTYTWTRNNTGTVTGIAASGSGNISGTLTNTTFAPVTVTFTITPSANGCPGPSITATVLVNPTPNAVATPASQTICSGNPIITIVLSGAVAGTTYTWTRNNTVTVTGIAASGAGNISGSLTNTTTAPITVTFTIIPTANGCPGPAITATVLVNPTPNAVATPASQTICSGATITTIVFTGAVAGTTYNWTRDNNATVTGIAASGAGNISGSLTNTTTAPITVTFTITPIANGCPGAPITATVLVNPTPDAVATPPSQTICSGNTITTIVLTGAVAGTTFNWTRNNTVTVTGIAASGSGNISGALTNTTNAPIIVTFTITPTANGCPGPAITATVLVNPTPNAVATPATQTICSGGSITTIVLTSAVAGTTFNWTRNNTVTVTGIAASGSGNISGVLTNTTIAPITVTFTITPTANGCPGAPITATVVVNPTPTITCPGNIVVNAIAGTCATDVSYPPATATGVPAPVITYSIPSGSIFPVGVTTVTATASNICGTVTCSFTITVLDVRVPLITTQPVNRTVCVGSSATFSVVATNVASYQWQVLTGAIWSSIAGATASSFTINPTTLSMNNNNYRVVLTGPCGTVVISNAVVLVVNPLPLLTLSSASNPVLLPGRTVTITATVSPAGGTFVWLLNGIVMPGVTGSSLGPLTVLNVGTYTVIYTDPNGCVSTSSPFVVSAGVTNFLWVYPNPNTGQFNVRFYNITGETATLKIFNYLGQVVYTQTLVLGVAYSNFLIDMRRHAAGIYTVRIVNGSGAEMAAKRLLIYHP